MISLYGSNPTLLCFALVAEATSPRQNRVVLNPSNECSKCPWSHAKTLARADVVHTLRCHFITTTKLSKSCQPTRFPNWRNHHSINPSEACQRLTTQIERIIFPRFFRSPLRAFPGVFHSTLPVPGSKNVSQLYRPYPRRQPTPKTHPPRPTPFTERITPQRVATSVRHGRPSFFAQILPQSGSRSPFPLLSGRKRFA
jgi:hypothetical protein